jgi:hypothetical protein
MDILEMTGSPTEWKTRVADAWETELRDIQKHIWRMLEISEPSTLEDWQKDADFSGLVAHFREEFSFLSCLQRECRKADQLLEELNEATPGSPTLDQREQQNVFEIYHLPYFRHRTSQDA